MTKHFLPVAFLPSHIFIPTQHNMYFILFFCAQSGLAQVHKKQVAYKQATRVLVLLLKTAGWDGVFICFWSACNMHSSSVIWVKTKVLWCCTIVTTGPVFHIPVQWKIVCIMIGIADQIQRICFWLTGWQRVSGGRQMLLNNVIPIWLKLKIQNLPYITLKLASNGCKRVLIPAETLSVMKRRSSRSS